MSSGERKEFVISGNSPATATTAAVGSEMKDLSRFDWFSVDAKIIGSTNGSVTLRLQRYVTGLAAWVDWLAFPLVAAGATKYYSLQVGTSATVHEVGIGTSPALAANTSIGGHPGDKVRCIATAGASTDSAAAQVVVVTAWKSSN
jgi:hypothetical protein